MCGIAGIAAADPRRSAAGARGAGGDDRRRSSTAAPTRTGTCSSRAWRSACAGSASSTRPAARSRSRSEDGEVTAVFNGEIYNFRELRGELAGARPPLRHRAATARRSSTSTRSTGPRFVERLRGMFAIALWDRAARRLVLARDRMGVKPLYVAESAAGPRLRLRGQVADRRRARAARARPARAPSCSWPGATCPGPLTLFAGVRKLDARHLPRLRGRPRWSRSAATGRPGTARRRASALLARRTASGCSSCCATATGTRMVSDVPLGRDAERRPRLEPDHRADGRGLRAPGARPSRSGSPRTPSANELADARRVARAARHRSPRARDERPRPSRAARRGALAPRGADRRPVLPRLRSCSAGWRGETVTVALSGQGADELLGGYRKHQVARGRRPARARCRRRGRGRARGRARERRSRRAARGLRALSAATTRPSGCWR